MRLQKSIDRLIKELENSNYKSKLFFAAQNVVIELQKYIEKTDKYISEIEFDQFPIRKELEELREYNNELKDLCCKLVDISAFEIFMARNYPKITRRPEYGSDSYNEILHRAINENTLLNGIGKN